MTIEEAIEKADSWLTEIQGVAGIAQGLSGGKDCITVFVTDKNAASQLPEQFHGYHVTIEFSGTFHSQT